MHKGPVIAALYPVGMLLLQLLVAIVLGGLLTSMGKSLLMPYLGIFGHLIALAAGMVLFGAVLDWFRKKRQQNIRLLSDARLRIFGAVAWCKPARA